ncbi:MAG TPA: TonB-dependent receptor [Polyangiales bacterium]|nr:TonB-dependent receptor [Polyangiales bacterium]
MGTKAGCLSLAMFACALPGVVLAQDHAPTAGAPAPDAGAEPQPSAAGAGGDGPSSGLVPAASSVGSTLPPAPDVAPWPAVSLQPSAAGEAEPQPAQEADYGAIGVAPGPYASQALDKLPNNAFKLDGRTLRSQHALGLHDALNAQLGSVVVNDVQSNPLQPDLQYRGFTAGPLLGTPQGISVYQNGVRLNEPFGELVQWDMIPLFALWDVQVMPGENAVYGLNTLGGSLVMRMKNGWNSPGARLEGSAGMFSRYRTTAEYGHAADDWSAYAGGSLFGEQGFRDKSTSSAQTFYGDARKRGSDYEVGVGLTLAHTDLNGNGPTPIELLRKDRAALYTWPDNTQNTLVLLSVDGQKRLARKLALQGTAYLRHTKRDTLNGDSAELRPCTNAAGVSALCGDDDKPLFAATGLMIPGDTRWNAVFNTTHTTSNGFGGSLQLESRDKLADLPNQFVAGASYDGSQVDFGQRTELGTLTVDRGVEGGGPSLRGAGRQTDLFAANHLVGVYALDTLEITNSLSLQASARLNWYSIALADRLGDALDGHHSYVRVNPALGLTQKLGRSLTLFAGYGEANRAPSAAELACADPDEPCRLPNAFISDPPLKQVVSRSAELGLRFRVGDAAQPMFSGSLAAFGARNVNDILFVAGSRVGTGYFRNAGDTQRLGAELALRGHFGALQLYAAYTFLRATFESELSLPRNATLDDDDDDDDAGQQQVKKGSRIPGLPMHAVKAGISYRVIQDLELGLSMIAQSSQPFRGDEGNVSPFVRGYVVLNAQASYRLLPEVTLFVRAQNLLNTKYETFGVLANPAEVLPNARDPRFLGPGAPLGVWAGIVIEDPT